MTWLCNKREDNIQQHMYVSSWSCSHTCGWANSILYIHIWVRLLPTLVMYSQFRPRYLLSVPGKTVEESKPKLTILWQKGKKLPVKLVLSDILPAEPAEKATLPDVRHTIPSLQQLYIGLSMRNGTLDIIIPDSKSRYLRNLGSKLVRDLCMNVESVRHVPVLSIAALKQLLSV